MSILLSASITIKIIIILLTDIQRKKYLQPGGGGGQNVPCCQIYLPLQIILRITLPDSRINIISVYKANDLFFFLSFFLKPQLTHAVNMAYFKIKLLNLTYLKQSVPDFHTSGARYYLSTPGKLLILPLKLKKKTTYPLKKKKKKIRNK